MNRYRTIYYSIKLKELNELTGLTFYQIEDTWENKGVLFYTTSEDSFDLEYFLNKGFSDDWELMELLNDKSNKEVERIIKSLINSEVTDLFVEVSSNKDEGVILFEVDLEELEDTSVNCISNILSSILKIPIENLIKINNQYYLYKIP